MDEQIEDIIYVTDELMTDSTIPKNVKDALEKVKNNITNKNKDVVKLTESMYLLQDISDDVNLPLNAKSDIWMLLSQIEKIKESIK